MRSVRSAPDGVPKRPPTFRPSHSPSRQQQNVEYDRRRGSARARGYTTDWDKASRLFLEENPLCGYCDLEGLTVAAVLVDHLYPQQVSSCTGCHSGMKQSIEHQGKPALDELARRLGRPVMGG